MIYNQSCGTDGALSQKEKNAEMSEFISAFFVFWDFCLFAIVVFFEVPLVLSFQGKNEKKNFIPDFLTRCLPHKFKYVFVAFGSKFWCVYLPETVSPSKRI